MRQSPPASDFLVRVTPWGRQSVSEGQGPRGSEDVHELDIPGGREGADAALAMASRCQRARHPSLIPLVHASAAADGRSVRLCWQAPDGSQLDEVAARHGAMPEAMVAALLHDLAAALVLAHGRELVLGCLSTRRLFLAPPGSDGVAALRLLGAGLPSLIEAGGFDIGGADGQSYALLYDEPGVVAPEVASGRSPGPPSDVFALGAIGVSLLIGRPVFPEAAADLQRFAMEEGPPADVVAEVRGCAPLLAPPLLAALSPHPLGRAGALAALREAIATRLGDDGVARVSIVRGGGPWEMGSPIIPLAAWAGTTAFVSRFRKQRQSRPSAVGITSFASVAADAGSVPQRSDGGQPSSVARPELGDALAEAKLRTALQELDRQRAQALRAPTGRRNRAVDLIVIGITAIIAATFLWMALRRGSVEAGPGPAPATWQQYRKAPPTLPKRTALPSTPGRRDR